MTITISRGTGWQNIPLLTGVVRNISIGYNEVEIIISTIEPTSQDKGEIIPLYKDFSCDCTSAWVRQDTLRELYLEDVPIAQKGK